MNMQSSGQIFDELEAGSIGEKRTFEIRVFNKDVRAYLKENHDHPIYNDRWCDTQCRLLTVCDEIELAKKLSELYPVKQGFVVEAIIEKTRLAAT